jgi:bifunctional DNA-binding transcriptional regulator/antitoxin component of YhaV-PrlF toxin-antitoxin module
MKSGRHSLVVVLPKDWVRGHGIEQGDELEVQYDGFVTVKAPLKEEEKDGDGK